MEVLQHEIKALYRALGERDEASWAEAWSLWEPRMLLLVRRHPQFRLTGEEASYFVNRALEKLWRAVDGEKLSQFQAPMQVIQYLKLCIHSAVVDELRLRGPIEADRSTATLDQAFDIPDEKPGTEAQAIDRVRRNELWRLVSNHIQTEEDRVLIEAALVRGLPPREIVARYRALFGSVEKVYKVKRNLLDRLSRDSRLRDFL